MGFFSLKEVEEIWTDLNGPVGGNLESSSFQNSAVIRISHFLVEVIRQQ